MFQLAFVVLVGGTIAFVYFFIRTLTELMNGPIEKKPESESYEGIDRRLIMAATLAIALLALAIMKHLMGAA